MKKDTDNTVVGSEELCLLMDALTGSIRDHRDDEDEKRQACFDYASCMRKREYQVGDEKRAKALQCVEDILQFWNMAEFPGPNFSFRGKNRVLIINEILGPGIALRLYTYYVLKCEKCRPYEPELLISLVDLIPMFPNSGISVEEGLQLYSLTRDLSERKRHSGALTSTLA